MESKIHLKVGAIEIDFEGTEDYIKNSLPGLVEKLLSQPVPPNAVPNEEGILLPDQKDPSRKKFELTTNSIASKLNVKSAADLILAASAHLVLVKGAETFLRVNLIAEMKTATNYYKLSYVNNLSSALKTLVKSNKLIERVTDTFALTAEGQKELESKLS